MNYTNGTYRLLYFLIDGVYLPVGCLTSNGISETADTIDTTTRQTRDGWATQRVVTQSYGIDFDGLVGLEEQPGVVSFKQIKDLKRSRSLISWKVENTQGEAQAEFGQGHIIDLSESASIDEFVSFSGSMVGFGGINDVFDNIYYPYIDRADKLGATLGDDDCIRGYINKLIE